MGRLHSVLTLSPLKISAGYFTFGVIWIPVTDVVLATGFASHQMPTLPGLVKGWTFIGLSTLLIFTLSRVHRQQMVTAQTRVETVNQQLQVLHRVFRHNIRNDLNVIKGYTDLVSERVTDEQSANGVRDGPADCDRDHHHQREARNHRKNQSAFLGRDRYRPHQIGGRRNQPHQTIVSSDHDYETDARSSVDQWR